MNGRASALRLLAAIVGVLCLWSQLAGVIHLALVIHVACPEHEGEVVHVGDGDAHELVAPPRADVPAVDPSHAEAPGDEHEHCSVAAHRSRTFLDAPTSATAVVVSLPHAREATSVASPPRSTPGRSIDVLVIAPTTSPPRV